MTLGLVLAGGGARGAYEAGVLRFVLGTLPKLAGEPVLPKVICGTSVGALNGVHAAAHAGRPGGPSTLSAFWRNLELSKVYRFEAFDLLRSPLRLFGRNVDERPALVDASPLHDFIRNEFPTRALRSAFRDRRLHAVVVTATEVTTGRCVHFVDTSNAAHRLSSRHASMTVVNTRLRPEHCIASCAIPFLFPPARINGRVLVDGSLRQNTPLSPALRLGADKVLVVGVKRPSHMATIPPLEDEPENLSLAFLAGKTFDALLLDPIEQDLARLEMLNDVFRWGRETYGDDFLTRMNAVVEPHRQAPFREIETLVLRPTQDLGSLAAQAWQTGEVRASRATRLLLETIAVRERPEEADLLSYLLFDRAYTGVLEELGYQDARSQQEDIARFLNLGSTLRPN